MTEDNLYVGCWVKANYGRTIGQVVELGEDYALVEMYRRSLSPGEWRLEKLNHQYRHHRKAVKIICKQESNCV